jgi:oligosaccharide repeat unit polymerase
LAFINYRISNSFAYPPVIFTFLWSIILFLLILSGDFFYPISEFTLLILLIGSITFSAGGFFALSLKCSISPIAKSQWENKVIDWSILLLLILFPFYIQRLIYLSALSGMDNFWIGLRNQTSSDLSEFEGIGMFAYILSLGKFSTIWAFSQSMRSSYSKRKTYLIIGITFLYCLSTATRSSTYTLVLPLIGVLIINNNNYKNKFKIAMTAMIVLLLLFSLFMVTGVFLGKGGNIENSLWENMISMKENFQIYLLAGIVAFDQSFINHIDYDLLFLFFIKILHLFGFEMQEKTTILQYTFTPHPTNVYTIYFSYYWDLGIFGLAVMMFLLGSSLSFVYRKAVLGHPVYIFFYGLSFSALLLSVFAETFVTTASYWIQSVFFVFVIYKVPSLMRSKKIMIRRYHCG